MNRTNIRKPDRPADDLDQYVGERSARDPEFRQAMQEGAAERDFVRAVVVARVQAGLTQRQLAERIGTSQPAIARMENGKLSPSLDMLHRLSQALGVTFIIRGDRLQAA